MGDSSYLISIPTPLGISFKKGKDGSVVVSKVKPESNAEKEGSIEVGVVILSVNGKSVAGLAKESVSALIKASEEVCVLKVIDPARRSSVYLGFDDGSSTAVSSSALLALPASPASPTSAALVSIEVEAKKAKAIKRYMDEGGLSAEDALGRYEKKVTKKAKQKDGNEAKFQTTLGSSATVEPIGRHSTRTGAPGLEAPDHAKGASIYNGVSVGGSTMNHYKPVRFEVPAFEQGMVSARDLLTRSRSGLDAEARRSRMIGMIAVGLAVLDGILLVTSLAVSGQSWHGDDTVLTGGAGMKESDLQCAASSPNCCAACDATLGTCFECIEGIAARRGCCATTGEIYTESVTVWLMCATGMSLFAWIVLFSAAFGFLLPRERPMAFWATIIEGRYSRAGRMRAWVLNTAVPTRQVRMVSVAGAPVTFQIPPDQTFDQAKGDQHQELRFIKRGEETFLFLIIFIMFVRLPILVAIPAFFPNADVHIDCFGCGERDIWQGIQDNSTEIAQLAEILLVVSFALSLFYSIAIYVVTPLHVSSNDVKRLRGGDPNKLVVSDANDKANDADNDDNRFVVGPPPSMQPIKFKRPPMTVDDYLGAVQSEHDTGLKDQVEEVPDPRPDIFFSTEAVACKGHYQGTNKGERISPPNISVADELVVMGSETEGCHIYFTTNGMPPTAGGNNRNTFWYNPNKLPVLLTGTVTTYMAIGRKPGFYDSMVTCIVAGELPVPAATLMPVNSTSIEGILRLDISSGIQCTDPMFAVEMFYTLDGSIPDETSYKWDPVNRPLFTFTSPESIMILAKSFSVHRGNFDFTCRIMETLIESPESEICSYDVQKLPPPKIWEEDSEVVSLQCVDHEWAELRYTTDGSEPTVSSALFSEGLESVLSMDIPGLFKVKCRAYAPGWIPSDCSELKVMRVHISTPIIAATFVPGSLTDDGAYVVLKIETHPPDASRFYTLDRSDPIPGERSTKDFVESLSGVPTKVWIPSSGVHIRAYSEKVGWVSSKVSSIDLRVRQLPQPTISRDNPGTITITANESCEEIQFTTDGSRPRALDPELAWMYEGKGTMGGTKVYSNANKPKVNLDSKNTSIIRAMAVAPGWIPSEITQLTIKVEASPVPTISVDVARCIPGEPVQFKFDCGKPNAIYYYSDDLDLPANNVSSSRHDLAPFAMDGSVEAVAKITAVAHAEWHAPSRMVSLDITLKRCATPTIDRKVPSLKVTLESATEGASIWFAFAAPHETLLQMPVIFGGSNKAVQPNVYDPDLPPVLDSGVPGVWTVYAVAFNPGAVLSEVFTSKTVVEKVKTPSISVINGKEFTRMVKVHCGTPSAKVLFSISHIDTMDNSEDIDGEPIINWKKAEFMVYVPDIEETKLPRKQNDQLLCRAQAFKDGFAQSGVCEFIILPTSQCIVPTIVRLLPAYSLSMESDTRACHIFYNIDVSSPPYPGVNSTRYTAGDKPIVPAVAGVHVVQAVAVKAGAAMSTVARVEVVVEKVADPIIDVQPIDETNGSTPVIISSSADLVKLYYTIDGTVPNPIDMSMTSSYGSNQGTMQFLGAEVPMALYPNRRRDGIVPLKVIATAGGKVDSNVVQIDVAAAVDTASVSEPAAVEAVTIPEPIVERVAPKIVPKVITTTKVGLTISLETIQGVLKVKVVNKTHPDWKIYYTMGEAHKLTNPSPTNEQSLLYEGEVDPAVRDAEGKFTPLIGKDAMSTKLCFAVRAIAISNDNGAKSRVVQKKYNFLNGFLTDLKEEEGMKFTIERKLRRVSMKGSTKHLGHKFSTGGKNPTFQKMDHEIVEERVSLEQSAAKRQMVLKQMRNHSSLLEAIADTMQTENYFLNLDTCAVLDRDHEGHMDVLDMVVEDLIDEAAEWWPVYCKSLKWFHSTKTWSKSKVPAVYLGKSDEHIVQALAESLIEVEKHVQDVYLSDIKFTEPIVADLCKIMEKYKFLQRVQISCDKSKISAGAVKKLDAAAFKGSVTLTVKHESWKMNHPVTAFAKLGLPGFR